MDIFTWSIPFVSEKGSEGLLASFTTKTLVTEMLYNLIKPSQNNEEDIEENDDENSNLSKKMTSSQDPKIAKPSKFFYSSAASSSEKEAEILRNKVKFVSKMMMLNKTLRYFTDYTILPLTLHTREQNETIVKLKGMCPGNRIPQGLLLEGSGALKDGNL